MIKDSLEKAINNQINEEFYSAYIYLSMAAEFGDRDLKGFENWMREQAKEEVEHAMRLFDYLEERGGKVDLEEIDKPKTDWNSPLEAFEDAYKHEKYITRKINDLVDLAEEENDRATVNMLQWFIEEQVEEEDSVSAIVEKLKMAGDNTSSLLMLDSELGNREASDESEEEQ